MQTCRTQCPFLPGIDRRIQWYSVRFHQQYSMPLQCLSSVCDRESKWPNQDETHFVLKMTLLKII